MPKRTSGRTETKPTRVTCPAEFVRFNIYKYSTVVCPHKLTNNYPYSIHKEKLPDYDEKMLVSDTITMIIQINGKLRDQITLKKGSSQKTVENIVLARKKIQVHIGSHSLKRIIFIQDRLINLVV